MYSPQYLDHVVALLRATTGCKMQPLEDGLPEPRRGHSVFLLAELPRQAAVPRRDAQDAVRKLSRRHELVRRDSVPQIRTWEFRR